MNTYPEAIVSLLRDHITDIGSGPTITHLRYSHKSECNDIVSLTPFIPASHPMSERIFCIVNGLTQIPVCIACGISPVKYKDFGKGYHKFCSTKCSTGFEGTQNKSKQTSLEKYGAESYTQTAESKERSTRNCMEKYGVASTNSLESVKRKKEATCRANYGCDHPLQSKEIKDKSERTNLQKYGTRHAITAPAVRAKIQRTVKERYGVDCVSQVPAIRNRAYTTNMKRYGVLHAIQNPIIKERAKNTCLKKYGVETPFKSEAIMDKIHATNLEKYGTIFPTQNSRVKQKRIDNSMKKYGVTSTNKLLSVKNKKKITCQKTAGTDHPMQSPIVREKAKNTMLDRYGADHNSKIKNANGMRLSEQTCLDKYGVSTPFAMTDFQEKSTKTCMHKYGVTHPMHVPAIKEKCFSAKRKLLRENMELNSRHYVPNIGKSETKILNDIEDKNGVIIQRQFPVCGYFVDGYDAKNNIVYEIDESHHLSQEYADKIRQETIEAHLGCAFVRIPV